MSPLFDLTETDFGNTCDLPPEFAGRSETSETWKDRVTTFLQEMDIRASYPTRYLQLIHNAREQLHLPSPGEQLRIRTQQTINLISLILLIIDTHQQIDELIIATYTLNRKALDILHDLLTGGRITSLHLLIASSYTFRDRKYYQYLIDTSKTMQAAGHDIHLTFAWSHFKITLARAGNDFYQFEGSMNYSENNMAEQLILENSKKTYLYDRDFILKTILTQNNKGLQIIC